MKRIDFLTKIVPAAVLGASLSSCKRRGEGGRSSVFTRTVNWRLASSFPRGLDTIFGASEQLAKRVKELSGGKFNIRVFPAGELVPGLQVMDAVQQGTVQMGHTASYYYTGKHPGLAFETGVPFGLTARQQNAWMQEGGGRELIQALLGRFNVHYLPGGNTGTQMGGWFRREIRSLADLKGLKMRIPGLGGQVMNRLGVNVQILSGGDIYPALERGAIDATEWVGPYDDEKLGFFRIAKHYYTPGWWEPGAALAFYINQKEWDQLPPVYRSILETASKEASADMLVKYDARNPEAMERLLAKGVKVHSFSQDIMEASEKAAFEIYEEESKKDPLYAEIYKSWKKFRAQSIDWFGVSENRYSESVGKMKES
ncbi:MAG: TRAP transporter substrate-binding protein [Spirochaetia bacterium]|nr:TRAP transporter substrate-binding protein [Spirochaetia bacterium]